MATDTPNRKQGIAIWYVFATVTGLLLLQWVWLTHAQIETIPYRTARVREQGRDRHEFAADAIRVSVADGKVIVAGQIKALRERCSHRMRLGLRRA